MKLTLEHYDSKITIESKNDDLTIDEVMQLVKQLLSGAGYSSNSIDRYFDD